MKSLLLTGLLTTVGFASFAQNTVINPDKCGYAKAHQWMLQNNPKYAEELEAYNHSIPELERIGAQMGQRATITIPVVFHIIHGGQAVGSGPNLSMTRIQQQLDRLNADYSRTNSDAGNTPASFTGVASNLEIQFCLATVDPNGNTTTGITRDQYTVSSETFIENTIKSQTSWDPTRYLNIWTLTMPSDLSGVLGYAYPPIPSIVGTSKDGLVLNYQNTGNNASANPVSTGRTATHEIGHYLGLPHPWGNFNGTTGCSADDGISDTPNSDDAVYGCPSHPHADNCISAVQFMNYMDYVDDNCMNMFTTGQRNVCRAVLSGSSSNNGVSYASRSSLINAAATVCTTNPNPGCVDLQASPLAMGFETGQALTNWAVVNTNGDTDANGNAVTWRTADDPGTGDYGPHSGTRFAMYFWNSDGTTAANDWLFTPCFSVVNGGRYRLRFWYAVASDASATYPEKLKVTVNSSQSVAGQVAVLQDFGTISNAFPGYQQASLDYISTFTGTASFGFQAYSAANQYVLQLDDINMNNVTDAGTLSSDELMFNPFPNPANDHVTVPLHFETLQKSVNVSVYNAVGQFVEERNLENVTTSEIGFNTSDYASGLYFFVLKTADKTITKKISIISE